MPDSNKLGVALLGLGSYSTTQIASALDHRENCKLTGIITGTPVKASMWIRKYNLSKDNVYSYQNFDSIVDNKNIDIVYVTVPNALHLDYVLRAARAKKHVICEKPLGLTAAECRQMIQACKNENVHLSIGYRLLYDPCFTYIRSFFGEGADSVSRIHGQLAFTLNDASDWRYNKEMAGGGTLMDIGIYGIYISCYILNQRPSQVLVDKSTIKQTTSGIETSLSFKLVFENVEVNFVTGYTGLKNELQIHTDSINICLINAFSPTGQLLTFNGEVVKLESINQLASHLDDFSNAILTGKPVKASGNYGLRDAQIISALYRSMETGKIETVFYD